MYFKKNRGKWEILVDTYSTHTLTPCQMETFCPCGRGETKNRSTKDIKIDKFKNWFEQWKNISIGVLHQMESTWKVTEV